MLVKPPVHDPIVPVKIPFKESTLNEVAKYREFYQSQVSAIGQEDLIELMVAALLTTDRDFKKWQREQAQRTPEQNNEQTSSEITIN